METLTESEKAILNLIGSSNRIKLVPCSRSKLMGNPKFREAHMRMSGKFNRQRNRVRMRMVRKLYWSK